ncbi:lactate/malate family dehydrogenase [Isoptericola variabilis]|uniref:Lactate/malate dehydrogenase n=1 Tax=Isoptericola variabilis (strain 225) TaxID=743718 RepID=F6FQQ7_ISOV2|nr:lactate dehydrogenase [Isoptericola variabilis]AEG42872.1 Lactate/malate dehydrogenase [Isoptericola variabilis 225]TWH31012.1 malate dehydrogenase [Isoptericola variabilis J7]
MDVAVLGATGDVGRQVCTQLIAGGLLSPTSRLQLVGRPDGASRSAAFGLRADLADAFEERAPLIDVALSPDEVTADVVVVTAGRTAPARVGISADRAALAAANLDVLRTYAEALARHGSGREVVIVVTNPVELGVAVMAEVLGRHRVIGMGAWLDTLRFRREIAVELGVRRHRVGGFVGGQHGERAVPLWSTVTVAGLDDDECAAAMAYLRRGRTLDTLPADVAAANRVIDEVAPRDVPEAFLRVDAMPADLRVVARPSLTHQSGAKTPAATAAATVDLVRTVLDGRDVVVAAQVALDGELDGVVDVPGRVQGVPVTLGPEGWKHVLLDPLADDEARLLSVAARSTDAMLAALGVGAGPDGAPVGAAATTPPDVAPGSEPRWTVDVEVVGAEAVGTVATLTSVFASRGVAVDSLSTRVTEPGGEGRSSRGVVALAFRAGERRARALLRTLERLAMVRAVVVHDPAEVALDPPR